MTHIYFPFLKFLSIFFFIQVLVGNRGATHPSMLKSDSIFIIFAFGWSTTGHVTCHHTYCSGFNIYCVNLTSPFPGVSKKIEALAKEKECSEVRLWAKSIVNHLYWTAATSRSGEESVAKWTSVANHIQNVHTHEHPLYQTCSHAPLQSKDRHWLKPGIAQLHIMIII